MNFWDKYQWTVVGLVGTVAVHLIVILLLNFSRMPETLVVDEIVMDFTELDFSEDEEVPTDQVDENGQPLTNVAANVNESTQTSSRLNEAQLNKEVDDYTAELLKQYESGATMSVDALTAIEKRKIEAQNVKNNLFDKNADDVDAVSGADGISATASYSLRERKDYDLPAPSYVCMAEGEVRVNIKVNNQGKVISATIVESKTTTRNMCLKENALKYARRAQFNDDYNAAAAQKGWIHFKYSKQ
ncbi:MAG: TonB family protein [Parvicellaceae bacterium]